MSISKEKLEKFKKLMEVANEGLSRDEFVKSFQSVIDHVLRIEKRLLEKISSSLNEALKKINTEIEAIRIKSDREIEGIKKQITKDTEKMFEEQRQNLNFIQDKVKRIKEGKDGRDGKDGINGKDGRDADENKVIKEVLNKIEVPEIDKTEIEELKKEIDDLKKRPSKGGGGVSAAAVQQAFKWILKTEQPSGDIDGANKAYTVTQPIFAVLAFSLNGEVIPQLPNYTISGKTITFSTALPAAYSGKDFEIKYI